MAVKTVYTTRHTRTTSQRSMETTQRKRQRTEDGVQRIKGKGSWTMDEDEFLKRKVAEVGRKWAMIARHLPGRIGKQCRERYVNHLDPNLKKGGWTEREEQILLDAHAKNGNKWADIAKLLPGRSENSAKNHWYSTIQRKYGGPKPPPKAPAPSDMTDIINMRNPYLPTNRQNYYPTNNNATYTTYYGHPTQATNDENNLTPRPTFAYSPQDQVDVYTV